MKGLYAAVALATLCAPSLAARFELSRDPLPPRTVSGKVIVELEPGSTIGARDGRDVDIHARFMEELDRRLPADSFRLRNKYNSAVFSGVALDLSSVEDIKTIAKTKGVKRIEPVRIIRQPPFKTTEAPNFKAAPDQFPPNIMTGVDKAHAAGLTGKGIKIGIVDSGIDYTHPALGGGFGAGFKVAGGYDFTGDDGNSPDDDPLDQCGGHGTHVAGIIAADPNNPYNVTGVAYDSTLYSYRVFGCNGETSTEIIMNAMIKAYEDGCDIVTMSLGGAAGWSYDILSQVGTNIAKAGRVVTIAAGNDGQYGPWYTSSPATGTDVIAVGSVDNIALAPLWQLTTTVPEAATVLYQWDGGVLPLPVGEISLPAYFTSRDPAITNDACSALPDSTPDLSGYVTFVRRGTCNFTIKIQNIVSKGGKVIIIMNGPGQPFAPINTGGYDRAALIQEADGNALLNAYLNGNEFTVSFPAAGDISFPPNLETGGLSSEFSSFGPSMDMLFKPAVSTPGGGILSTLPLTQNSYGIASGTSMATPHLAGISALLLQSKGKKVAKELRNLFETTATPIPVSRDEGAPRHTLAQAGAGLVNIANILAYETVLTPGELLLNDSANWKSSHTIYIKNTGRTAKTYTITHVPAQTLITYDAATSQVNEYPVPTDDTAVTVRFSLSKAIVLPGTTLPILVHIAAPTNPNADLLPIYSGQIEVSTDGETLRTSYLGAGKALKAVQVIDDTDWAIGVPFPLLLDGAGNIQEEPTNYTLVNGDYPLFFYRLLFDSPLYTIDLVSADATLPKSANKKAKRGFLGDWLSGAIGSWFPSFPSRSGSYAKVATIGRLFSYANEIRNDNYDYPYWSVDLLYDGTFANGTAVPLGSYKILARFLRVAGDAANQEDYESWLSPIVNIVAP